MIYKASRRSSGGLAFSNAGDVIASQCAYWRGNPLRFPESPGDCHGLRPRNDSIFVNRRM